MGIRSFRRIVLRADAIALGVGGTLGLVADLLGSQAGIGPQGAMLRAAPHAAVGFVEAHGLAVILAVLFWGAAPAVRWHIAAASVHLLLGASNVVFWRFFDMAGMLGVGIATTLMHAVFAALQLLCAAKLALRGGHGLEASSP